MLKTNSTAILYPKITVKKMKNTKYTALKTTVGCSVGIFKL